MFIFVGTGTSSWVSVAIFVASIIIPRLSLDYSAIWRRAVFCFRLGCLAVPAMAMARANSLRDFDPREWSANARGAIALILLAALPNLTMYPAIWSRAFILPAQILVRWGVAVPMLIACLAAFGYWDWRQCCHWLARCVRRFLQDIGPLFGPNNGFEQASTMNAAGIAKLALRLNALPLENFCPAEVSSSGIYAILDHKFHILLISFGSCICLYSTELRLVYASRTFIDSRCVISANGYVPVSFSSRRARSRKATWWMYCSTTTLQHKRNALYAWRTFLTTDILQEDTQSLEQKYSDYVLHGFVGGQRQSLTLNVKLKSTNHVYLRIHVYLRDFWLRTMCWPPTIRLTNYFECQGQILFKYLQKRVSSEYWKIQIGLKATTLAVAVMTVSTMVRVVEMISISIMTTWTLIPAQYVFCLVATYSISNVLTNGSLHLQKCHKEPQQTKHEGRLALYAIWLCDFHDFIPYPYAHINW